MKKLGNVTKLFAKENQLLAGLLIL